MRNFGWWIGCLVMSLAACGGATRNEREEDTSLAGRANGAGESGAPGGVEGVIAGKGGTAGDAGGTTGDAGSTTGDECGDTPKDLGEHCKRFECPKTPDDVELGDCDVANAFSGVSRRDSSCGGVSVTRNYGLDGGVTYHFDADGQLVGISRSSDVASDCPDTVGRQCTLQGLTTNLCDLARCEPIELQSWCSRPGSCAVELPKELQSLLGARDPSPATLRQLCSGGAGIWRFASSCDGAVYRYRSDTESSEWSFDHAGKLLGVAVTTDVAKSCLGGVGYSKVAVYGEPCEAVGEGVDQCDECRDEPKDLNEYCSRFKCPESPDDVGLRLCDDFDEGGSVIQRESSCGGVTVTMDSFFVEMTYHFDADGRLIGVVRPNALNTSACSIGRQCEAPYYPLTSLCHPARCAAAPLESWCGGLSSCPEADSPEALQQLCAAGDKLERFTSSCGGAVYRSGFREWSFDDAGKLAGVLLTRNSEPRCASGGYSKVHVFGEPCEAVGEGVDQCGAGDSSPAP